MNLHGIVSGVISAVNPQINVQWLQSTGYTTDNAGKRTPTNTALTVRAQVQALSATDIRHTEGLNMTGIMRSVYLYGDVAGIVRIDQKGGDILQFAEVPGGTVRDWLVSQVMETWPDWCRVIVTLQAN